MPIACLRLTMGPAAIAFMLSALCLGSTASADDFIKVPLRWCAVDGSPAVTNPGGAGQSSTDTVLWRRHERASDGIWKPDAEITFRSGMIRAIRKASSFPIIADPCPPTTEPLCQGGDADGISCTPDGMGLDPATCGAGVSCATQACPCSLCDGELGDVLDPNVDDGEMESAIDSCRVAWDDLEDQFSVSLAGPIVVNIREFLNQFGLMSSLRGRAAGPGLFANSTDPADICNTPPIDITSTNGGGNAVVVDNQIMTDPDELVLAHELGHVLWLRHGNGIDDDGNMRYDPDGLGLGFNCDPGETGMNDPPSLMHPNGLQATTVIRNAQRLTAREVAAVLPGAKEDPPGVDIDLEALGEEQRDRIDDGALIEMSWASIIVNEVQNKTVFSLGIPERLPISSDTQFLFFADLDDDPATGGSPNTIPGLLPAPTCFTGADIVTRLLLPFGLPPAQPTVWQWQGGAFALVADPDIRAEYIATVPFDADTSNTFETMAVGVPNSIVGTVAERVPGQAIADFTLFTDGDRLADEFMGECSVPFRMVRPDFPTCLVTPDPVDPGDTVTVEATGLWEGETAKVILGDLVVGEDIADITGAVSVDFDIPIDSPSGPRLVTVGTMGTSLTADCAVEVRGGTGDFFEEVLVGVVFDTGEFVRIDRATGAGTRIGASDPRYGLTHYGAQLFGIDANRTFWRLDPANGATLDTWLPGFPGSEEGAVAYRRDGVAFATRDGGSLVGFWRFGAIDGGAVQVNPNIGIRFDGLAFSQEDELFGLAENGELFEINQLTGIPRLVGPTGLPANNTAGLTFADDGRLYAAVGDKLFRLSLATGAASVVGPIGFGEPVNNRGFSGLAAILLGIDSDEDGVADHRDNCLAVANPDQRDTNADGFGNLCDADLNNDCRINFLDLRIMEDVFFTGSDPDADFNGDGIANFVDLQQMQATFFTAPGPSGAPNSCDD